MTSFEHFFYAIKKALGRDDLFDLWPDFEPVYFDNEYTWTTLYGLGEVLILNCGKCEGPSDLRHKQCKICTEKRSQFAKEDFLRSTGHRKTEWKTILLCRIHKE